MDAWTPLQRKKMELGGNKRLRDFLRSHGIPDSTPIKQKYNTIAADWYRKNLQACAEGSECPPPIPEGTGHLPLVSEICNSTAPSSVGPNDPNQDSLLVGLLGPQVGPKVADGVWGALGVAKNLGGKSRSLEERVQKVQEDGWADVLVDTTLMAATAGVNHTVGGAKRYARCKNDTNFPC